MTHQYKVYVTGLIGATAVSPFELTQIARNSLEDLRGYIADSFYTWEGEATTAVTDLILDLANNKWSTEPPSPGEIFVEAVKIQGMCKTDEPTQVPTETYH